MLAEIEPSPFKVIESAYTVSGNIIVLLEGSETMLGIETILHAANGNEWVIKDNNLTIGKPSDMSFQQKIKSSHWFSYKLHGIGHTTKPEVGELLWITIK